MSEAIQDLMDQLASLEKSTLDIGDNYRQYLYKGTPLPEDFDKIFFEVLDRSRKFHAAMNQVLNGIESGSIRPSRKITPDEMRSRFYKCFETIQDVQVKIIDKKKSYLRQYNKSLNSRLHSGTRSQLSAGTNNQTDKTDSFVRFSNNNSSTPNQIGQMMYKESGGSSLEDEISQESTSQLDLSSNANNQQDVETMQKVVVSIENEISQQENKLNMIKEIQDLIAKEREAEWKQKREAQQQKLQQQQEQQVQLADGRAQRQQMAAAQINRSENNLFNESVVQINQQQEGDRSSIKVPLMDEHQGTTYEQAKRKKIKIIVLVVLLLAAIAAGVCVILLM